MRAADGQEIGLRVVQELADESRDLFAIADEGGRRGENRRRTPGPSTIGGVAEASRSSRISLSVSPVALRSISSRAWVNCASSVVA